MYATTIYDILHTSKHTRETHARRETQQRTHPERRNARRETHTHTHTNLARFELGLAGGGQGVPQPRPLRQLALHVRRAELLPGDLVPQGLGRLGEEREGLLK